MGLYSCTSELMLQYLTISHALTSPFMSRGELWGLCSMLASTLPHGEVIGIILLSNLGEGRLVCRFSANESEVSTSDCKFDRPSPIKRFHRDIFSFPIRNVWAWKGKTRCCMFFVP